MLGSCLSEWVKVEVDGYTKPTLHPLQWPTCIVVSGVDAYKDRGAEYRLLRWHRTTMLNKSEILLPPRCPDYIFRFLKLAHKDVWYNLKHGPIEFRLSSIRLSIDRIWLGSLTIWPKILNFLIWYFFVWWILFRMINSLMKLIQRRSGTYDMYWNMWRYS